MKFRADINCDLGEAFTSTASGIEKRIIPFITSVNIACGFHAGNPTTMAETVNVAKKNGVAVGAHPGLPDLAGFGRRQMDLSADEIRNIIIYQVGALTAVAQTAEKHLQHVKPHGALYNGANTSEDYAVGIISAMKRLHPDLILFTMAGSKMARMAIDTGLRVAHEAFADRAYNSDGSLASRETRGAVIGNPDLVAKRAVKMIKERRMTAINGITMKLPEVDTICFHSDTPNASRIARSIREKFEKEAIEAVPAGAFV
ncbi:LamB/YcsF family protein [Candidatus Bathyarchaeota archaeon]|nr:LamB/YcsF family protein [Candidatus Bathyarchaeota archaeon]